MPPARPTRAVPLHVCQSSVAPTSQATTVRLNWNLPVQAASGRPPLAAAAGRPGAAAAGPSDPARRTVAPQGKSETQIVTQ